MRFSLLSVFVFIFFVAAVAQEPGLQQAGKPVSKINIQPIAPAVSKRLLLFRDNGTGKYGFLDSLTSQPVIQAQFDKSAADGKRVPIDAREPSSTLLA